MKDEGEMKRKAWSWMYGGRPEESVEKRSGRRIGLDREVEKRTAIMGEDGAFGLSAEREESKGQKRPTGVLQRCEISSCHLFVV